MTSHPLPSRVRQALWRKHTPVRFIFQGSWAWDFEEGRRLVATGSYLPHIMSRIVECVPNFSEGQRKEVREDIQTGSRNTYACHADHSRLAGCNCAQDMPLFLAGARSINLAALLWVMVFSHQSKTTTRQMLNLCIPMNMMPFTPCPTNQVWKAS